MKSASRRFWGHRPQGSPCCSRKFTKWVLLANVIAWPAAYVIMSRWHQNFAYQSGIGLGTFLLAGGLAWAIAFLTVSYQAIKASIADPIAALKYE